MKTELGSCYRGGLSPTGHGPFVQGGATGDGELALSLSLAWVQRLGQKLHALAGVVAMRMARREVMAGGPGEIL